MRSTRCRVESREDVILKITSLRQSLKGILTSGFFYPPGTKHRELGRHILQPQSYRVVLRIPGDPFPAFGRLLLCELTKQRRTALGGVPTCV